MKTEVKEIVSHIQQHEKRQEVGPKHKNIIEEKKLEQTTSSRQTNIPKNKQTNENIKKDIPKLQYKNKKWENNKWWRKQKRQEKQRKTTNKEKKKKIEEEAEKQCGFRKKLAKNSQKTWKRK